MKIYMIVSLCYQMIIYSSCLTKQRKISQHTSCKLSDSPKKKPETILYYNSTKGGVDSVDERIGTYSVKYKTKRWHVTVFCNILDMACYNDFVLYCDIFPE